MKTLSTVVTIAISALLVLFVLHQTYVVIARALTLDSEINVAESE